LGGFAQKVGNMFSKTHQGIVKKTVVLEFENGYQITLDAGVEMSMHLVMDEAQIARRPTKRAVGRGLQCACLPPLVRQDKKLVCRECRRPRR
jgi:hypothetical protein